MNWIITVPVRRYNPQQASWTKSLAPLLRSHGRNTTRYVHPLLDYCTSPLIFFQNFVQSICIYTEPEWTFYNSGHQHNIQTYQRIMSSKILVNRGQSLQQNRVQSLQQTTAVAKFLTVSASLHLFFYSGPGFLLIIVALPLRDVGIYKAWQRDASLQQNGDMIDSDFAVMLGFPKLAQLSWKMFWSNTWR